MSPIFALVLMSGVPAQTGDANLVLSLRPGQELTYRGRYEETSNAAGGSNTLGLEIHVLVLAAKPDGYEVAFLTKLSRPGAAPASNSAQLELAYVDRGGRVTLRSGGLPLVPLDGPPTLEPAGFVERPVGAESKWDVAEGRRPPRQWHVEATEYLDGRPCVKLTGVQQSAAWHQLAQGATAWRRQDIVWLSVEKGIVRKLQRVLERRDGGHPATKSRVEYDLVGDVEYKIATDQQVEVQLAWKLQEKLSNLLSAARRGGPQPFEELLSQIVNHIKQRPATPYRDAILTLQQRIEAARRGETPPVPVLEPMPDPVAVGRPAPDFVTTDLRTGANERLARWRGRPLVLAFVRPDDPLVKAMLYEATLFQGIYGERARIALLAVGNGERLRQVSAAEFPGPVLAGRDVADLYGPGIAWVVVDADGVIRFLGDARSGSQALQAAESCLRK